MCVGFSNSTTTTTTNTLAGGLTVVRPVKNDVSVRISLSLPLSLLDAVRDEQAIMCAPLSTTIARLVRIGINNRKDGRRNDDEGVP